MNLRHVETKLIMRRDKKRFVTTQNTPLTPKNGKRNVRIKLTFTVYAK